MSLVKGRILCTEPISLSSASSFLRNFLSSPDHGAACDVFACLKRAAAEIEDLNYEVSLAGRGENWNIQPDHEGLDDESEIQRKKEKRRKKKGGGRGEGDNGISHLVEKKAIEDVFHGLIESKGDTIKEMEKKKKKKKRVKAAAVEEIAINGVPLGEQSGSREKKKKKREKAMIEETPIPDDTDKKETAINGEGEQSGSHEKKKKKKKKEKAVIEETLIPDHENEKEIAINGVLLCGIDEQSNSFEKKKTKEETPIPDHKKKKEKKQSFAEVVVVEEDRVGEIGNGKLMHHTKREAGVVDGFSEETQKDGDDKHWKKRDKQRRDGEVDEEQQPKKKRKKDRN